MQPTISVNSCMHFSQMLPVMSAKCIKCTVAISNYKTHLQPQMNGRWNDRCGYPYRETEPAAVDPAVFTCTELLSLLSVLLWLLSPVLRCGFLGGPDFLLIRPFQLELIISHALKFIDEILTISTLFFLHEYRAMH